jgi:hypothetical protein
LPAVASDIQDHLRLGASTLGGWVHSAGVPGDGLHVQAAGVGGVGEGFAGDLGPGFPMVSALSHVDIVGFVEDDAFGIHEVDEFVEVLHEQPGKIRCLDGHGEPFQGSNGVVAAHHMEESLGGVAEELSQGGSFHVKADVGGVLRGGKRHGLVTCGARLRLSPRGSSGIGDGARQMGLAVLLRRLACAVFVVPKVVACGMVLWSIRGLWGVSFGGGGTPVKILGDRRRLAWVLALTFLLVPIALSGCLGGGPGEPTGDDEDSLDGSPSSSPDEDSGAGTDGEGSPSGNETGPKEGDPKESEGDDKQDPSGNQTQPDDDGNVTVLDDPWAGDDPVWSPMSQASIRPGVRVGVAADQCTSNFVFRDRVDGSLFLGLAAHCVHGHGNAEVSLFGIDGQFVMQGKVAYSSWEAVSFDPDEGGLGGDVHPHDFALIEIPREHRDEVHPAVLEYGGPTALAQWDDVGLGDVLWAYGHSMMRPTRDLDAQQGHVLDTYSRSVQGSEGFTVVAHMLAPPMPGDSGSPLLTADGEALGVLSALTIGTPYGFWWEYSSLPHAVSFAADHMGRDLVLATWDEFDPGMI